MPGSMAARSRIGRAAASREAERCVAAVLLRGTRDSARQLAQIVRLSGERTRQAVRQDCSFAKKQESPAALLVVVRRGS